MSAFWEEGRWQASCAVRDCPDKPGSWDVHHVCYAQHVRAIDPSQVDDPRNSLRVTNGGFKLGGCHGRHHGRQRKIKVSELRDDNIVFAIELMGRGPAQNYFERYYDDDGCLVERLDAAEARMVTA